MQAEFFNNLMPIQQKEQRVPITLQGKVDGKLIRVYRTAGGLFR